MLVNQLSRIAEFRDVAPGELRALAGRARILCLPGQRWLVRNHRDLAHHFYLLRGTLRTFNPDAQLKYSSFGRLKHFYPGCGAVLTSSACQVLIIETSQREFLLDQAGEKHGIIGGADTWLAEFLGTHMMQELEPPQWRALLGAFQRVQVSAGEVVVERGDQASACFVVESGHAVIHRAGRTLRHLNPGDFFGEDGLILDAPRNATVTALQDMVVHAIDGPSFERLLLGALVQPVSACVDGVQLNLGDQPVAGARSISRGDLRGTLDSLDQRACYYVVGGDKRQRILVAFLLIQRGMRAHPLIN